MSLVDAIYNSYQQVRQSESLASTTQYTPLRWQGEIGDETLDGIQHVIFHELELLQVAEANAYGDNYIGDSTGGRDSSGPVVQNVRVQKVAGGSENTRLVTISFVDRATRIANGSSNPELRDGEPGCAGRRACYTWNGSEYVLFQDCGGVGCQSGSVPTSYTEEKVYVACESKKIESGVGGWPIKTIVSVPATPVQQLNNPSTAASGHPIKVLGPNGWTIADGDSPIGSGAAATWPKKFSEIVPKGVDVSPIVPQDTHPAISGTPLFHSTPTASGQISIDPSGNIVRVHSSTYIGPTQYGKIAATPNSGVFSG